MFSAVRAVDEYRHLIGTLATLRRVGIRLYALKRTAIKKTFSENMVVKLCSLRGGIQETEDVAKVMWAG